MTGDVAAWHPTTPAGMLRDETDMVMSADWSQVKTRPTNPPEPIWYPDRMRADDRDYVRTVEDFVTRFIPAGSPSDAVVLGDNTGHRVLVTTSYLDPNGNITGIRRAYAAELPKGTQLP
ncbi:hypothetical protein [Enemella evansiae]|uniref:hypothetical protein n=1 Tax=Enemella evansiae TaxID=2016499 RepID=UPI000B95D7A6|nr:hypothetical protein [Enemella evansiae]OYO01222.1 hypothetical protein CGZ97_17460 [Enemella evansiae]